MWSSLMYEHVILSLLNFPGSSKNILTKEGCAIFPSAPIWKRCFSYTGDQVSDGSSPACLTFPSTPLGHFGEREQMCPKAVQMMNCLTKSLIALVLLFFLLLWEFDIQFRKSYSVNVCNIHHSTLFLFSITQEKNIMWCVYTAVHW